MLDFAERVAEETITDLVQTHGIAIGRYDENRPESYDGTDFEGRTLHLGLDLFVPAGSPVHAFAPGTVVARAYHAGAGDYGGTLITHHPEIGLYALHGHLTRASAEQAPQGAFAAGALLGHIGAATENGGYPPHLHFQLAREAPLGATYPGVLKLSERVEGLKRFPDPRTVLGALY